MGAPPQRVRPAPAGQDKSVANFEDKQRSEEILIRVRGDGKIAQALRLEAGKEAEISNSGDSIEIRIVRLPGESWASLRSRVNTILRVAETVGGTLSAADKND